MKKKTSKAGVAKTAKASKVQPVKFDGDWRKLPSGRMLLAVCIKALESGKQIPIPTTREEAAAILGYEVKEGGKAA